MGGLRSPQFLKCPIVPLGMRTPGHPVIKGVRKGCADPQGDFRPSLEPRHCVTSAGQRLRSRCLWCVVLNRLPVLGLNSSPYEPMYTQFSPQRVSMACHPPPRFFYNRTLKYSRIANSFLLPGSEGQGKTGCRGARVREVPVANTREQSSAWVLRCPP